MRTLASLVLTLVIAALATGCGFRTTPANGTALDLPEEGFDWAPWTEILAAHVDETGVVDWSGLATDDTDLRNLAETLATAGPKTTPERFATEDDELAYFINAYNILIALGVVHHWPIASVHDVSHWLSPRRGFGFFYAQRFVLDGRDLNLYGLENQIIIKEYEDARIHAAINCASASCPMLRAEAYTGADLDAQLDEASRVFASEAPHVRVDTDAETVELSMIYQWYAEDFERDAVELGQDADVLAWIAHYATDEVAADVERARAGDWTVSYVTYDWALNGR